MHTGWPITSSPKPSDRTCEGNVSMANTITRRAFFNHTAVYAGAAFLTMNFPRTLRAAKESDTPAVLSTSEWATVEAITGRIIPTDSDPGGMGWALLEAVDRFEDCPGLNERATTRLGAFREALDPEWLRPAG